MPKKPNRSMCAYCTDNYYNGVVDGGCWSLQTAEVVTRSQVGTWDIPPYTWRPQQVLNCHRPKGLHWLKESDARFTHNCRRRAPY